MLPRSSFPSRRRLSAREGSYIGAADNVVGRSVVPFYNGVYPKTSNSAAWTAVPWSEAVTQSVLLSGSLSSSPW